MLDSALKPSYNLSKNLLLLPWILKLIDMVNDSAPLLNDVEHWSRLILSGAEMYKLSYSPPGGGGGGIISKVF